LDLAGGFVLVLELEDAGVSSSERWNKNSYQESNSLFAAEAQQIEHELDDEHDSPNFGMG
jgi:hypothetical protein